MPDTGGFHTEMHCAALGELTREDAIRAIHAAYLQLMAVGTRAESAATGTMLDNRPAIYALRECLRKAGHLGFEGKGA